MPTISKLTASVPVSEITLVPNASSVTVMSATLILEDVSVFSGRMVVVFVKATTVGASFTSIIASEKD